VTKPLTAVSAKIDRGAAAGFLKFYPPEGAAGLIKRKPAAANTVNCPQPHAQAMIYSAK
jgi:hypothetical protein